jgi:transcriptional regulator with XRE-family HTH domain
MELDVKKLRRAMAAKYFSVVGLARAAGVSASAVNTWLNHQTRPRMDTIGKLARALDMDIFELTTEEA